MWTELEQLSTVPVHRMLVPVRPSIFGTCNCFSRPPGRIVWPQVRQICTSQTEKFSRYTLILYFSPIKY